MRKIILQLINALTTCRFCHGLGYRETGNDTIECDKCDGKGYN